MTNLQKNAWRFLRITFRVLPRVIISRSTGLVSRVTLQLWLRCLFTCNMMVSGEVISYDLIAHRKTGKYLLAGLQRSSGAVSYQQTVLEDSCESGSPKVLGVTFTCQLRTTCSDSRSLEGPRAERVLARSSKGSVNIPIQYMK
ncbi:hypothetical protein EVAR_73396_1 [Eumeta japonica]|uniref:Uncharacterized protein n=1 Tax=Eumeta variegata TaxID=151549 RepID=A0A4C1T977_EUMVA|nr:hypothetical protein EVAR_73396_1 [Eumeta japonica]